MTHRLSGLLLLLTAQVLLAQKPPPPFEEIDIVKSPRLYGTHFGRYGKAPSKVIHYEKSFVRFTFPSGGKITESDQHGIYSYFALVGDFEVEADFELKTLVVPEKGYGSAVGIALETNTPSGNAQLLRGFTGDKASAFIVNRAIPQQSGDTKYDVQAFPSTSKRGKLGLKREKEELIFLASDNLKEPPKELVRLPFTKDKVAKLLLMADRGGDDNAFDNFVGNLKVKASEITGGLAREELAKGPNWLKWVCLLTLLGGAGFFVRRWQRGRKVESRGRIPAR